MEPVLLGLAAPTAVSETGNLLERSLRAAAEPFAAVLQTVIASFADDPTVGKSSEVGQEIPGQYLTDLQATLAGRIRELLTTAGVDLAEPIGLRISAIDGRVEVVGDHPQKPLIESALATESELEELLAELIALHQLLHPEGSDDNDSVELSSAEAAAILSFSVDQEGPTLTFS